jgi:hypothetical protein
LHAALDDARGSIDFFFRDDDAGQGDERLWALLEIFENNSLPVDLAVIPCDLKPTTARGLLAWMESESPRVGLHQHGFAHVNHEPTGRNYEFGPSRERWLQQRDIAEGRRRLQDLLGSVVDPIFTPPWNRCTEETGRCLAELDFKVLSREARAEPLSIPGLVELPIDVDWFAQRKHVRLERDEFGRLLARRVRESQRVGLMFHHAVMDKDEHEAAGELLTLLAGHPRVQGRSMSALAGTEAQDGSLSETLSELRS